MSDTVVEHTVYVHRDKESNWDSWGTLCGKHGGDSEGDAGSKFSYCGYEVGLATMVDMKTGRCVAYGIYDGKTLVNFEKEVELT